ncbi:hypothetical protein K5I29_11825 [Flavobacterium agricola]|uniref:Tail specific protease domain-containing protein n=1 Tax=Flavobacterium agricola TaxID=2870839 RepID=A0ABY6M088_9FLAO|nr:S41 family peptidase [Flavobacterium agricola]UYW01140.1 hypothetical protein K5I29_11825 [Flavobacterium agricola]
MKKIIGGFILIGSLFACQSAKKHNAFNQSKISVAKLHQDITYLQNNFLAMHPDADLYISADSLNQLFASTKKNITTPLTPKQFYSEIAPIIAAVRQGHSRVVYPSDRTTKQQDKANKNTKGPVNQFTYKWFNNTLYIAETTDSLKQNLIGSKVISIEDVKPEVLYKEYSQNNSGDGFSPTYIPQGFNKRFTALVYDKIGIRDSITFVLSKNDSLFTATNVRIKTKKSSQNSHKKDSIQTLTKVEKKQQAKQNKHKFKQKKMLGWDNKAFVRELLFPIADDSTFAVLKIHKFSDGRYKAAYDSLFTYIKNKGVNHLALDLSNNPGGLVAEINELYSYLKYDADESLLRETKINSRGKFPFQAIKGKSFGTYVALTPFYVPVYVWAQLNTKKDSTGNYQIQIPSIKPKPIKKNVYQGKLSVLVNGGSFSAACILTSNLQGSNRALVYGEETGGTYNGTVAGIMPYLKLPNSKLRVRTGLIHIKPTYQTETLGRGIIPDVPIKLTTGQALDKDYNLYKIVYKAKSPK